MARLVYLTHPQVEIDPAVPVPDWGLSALGRARVQAVAAEGWPGPLRIVASPERKAQETAALLGTFELHPGMGEVDRSATGYVPHARHEALADALFAAPSQSAEGWERAVDAQARMLGALADLRPGDLLLVGHGAVGTLLWCALTGAAIRRAEDQPAGGGCAWEVERETGRARHGWRRMESVAGLTG